MYLVKWTKTDPNLKILRKILYYYRDFFFAVATCHTVIVENNDNKISYNASSPDELALVNGARYFGIKFIERTNDNDILIEYKDKINKFRLLKILEFNSDR